MASHPRVSIPEGNEAEENYPEDALHAHDAHPAVAFSYAAPEELPAVLTDEEALIVDDIDESMIEEHLQLETAAAATQGSLLFSLFFESSYLS